MRLLLINGESNHLLMDFEAVVSASCGEFFGLYIYICDFFFFFYFCDVLVLLFLILLSID